MALNKRRTRGIIIKYMEVDKLLNDLLKLPETLTDAIALVKKSPLMASIVDEAAFKQTVINVLIAAGLVSENDFNASVEYFKDKMFEEFGKELLKESKNLATEVDDDDWDCDDGFDDDIPKA